jgi:phage terminase large subunit-like protein
VGVGIDKGQTSDLSAIVVAQRQGDRVVIRSRVFPPHPATGRVNTESMRAYLRDLRGRFPVPQARDEKTGRALQGPAFAYDRWAFSESAETLEQEGLAMVDFPQNATTMGPASTQAFELITTGRLAHDGDAVLAEHVANTTAILTERGMKVTKPKKVTPRKNDACVAMVMAVAMAMQEAPKPFVRTPRVPVGF